jgi:class 3 adenylate cyclase
VSGNVAPGETLTLTIDARRGWHDVFCPAVHALCYLVGREESGVSEVDVELYDGQTVPEQVDVKPGPLTVRVHNNLEARVPIGIGFLGDDDDEHPEPTLRIEPFLTGKRVLTNQTFRSLFKAETFEVGTGMHLKSLAVLFTDLQASTAMYERVGDLNALGIVRRHFEVLEAAVAKHRGAVVKTIGDAVMAVFAEPERAMAAAAEMIETVRRAVAHGEDLTLKIGLHVGSCVATQSNNQNDYFGRTVNIAARIQALAEGGQIVCSEDVWQAAGVQRVIAERGLTARREVATLRGIQTRYPVRRIVVIGSLAPRARRAPAKPRSQGATAARKSAAKQSSKRAGRRAS